MSMTQWLKLESIVHECREVGLGEVADTLASVWMAIESARRPQPPMLPEPPA